MWKQEKREVKMVERRKIRKKVFQETFYCLTIFFVLAENFDVREEGASIPSPEEQSLEHEFWTQETWKWLLPDRCKVLENQVLTSGKGSSPSPPSKFPPHFLVFSDRESASRQTQLEWNRTC